jgi:class 3 adenylate cyclase/tetratricopeptide (TPR) repeat protein
MRLVSVLFVDLVGFTALSESRDAADVRELLGRYFDSARTIVERYGGTIEKFIGDAVMAVWGAPVAREDDAERAVRAALDMVESVEVFGHEVGAPDLRARAGVVTGQVAALENPGEGLVVGDRVNTASRVQSAAQPGTVLVDEVTRGVTSASIFYEDAGEHSVKGKAEPLRLWHALRVVAGVAGNQREEGLEAPFVGREADLRLLKELFHQSLDRRTARLVAVSGEAGIGKSRLRREFFQYIDGLAGTVLWHSGRCLSYGEGVAYWALAEMVRQRFGIPEDAPPDEAGEKMAAGLGRWVPDPADREFLAPRLGALLGLGEPGLSREELSAGWRMFFDRLAAHEPVALVFEDLQWADPGLLEFIEQLLDWSSGSPIFILTLARPELAENHGGWPAGHRGATTLQLDPLGPAAMHELLAGVVPALPPGPSSRIVERAEGVPLYAIETVRALIDRGVLAEHEGSLVLRGEVGELDVPASLGSLLAARIDALEPGERQLVKAMSVFGGSFPRSTAAALSGVDAAELDRLLAGLVRKQVLAIRADPLSPDRGQYGFAQGLLRTVAYEMLSRQEQRARHVAAAQHLREAFPNEGEEVAEVIAHHLLDAYRAAQEDPGAAELRAETVVALRRAGNRAATVGAPETAMRNFLSARELAEEGGEWAEFTELAGSMAMLSGRSELALELLEAAAEANLKADRRREGARVAERIGEVLGRLGRLEEAATRCSEALEAFGADELHPDAGLLNHRLGRSRAYAGDYPGAIGPLERALQIAEALELPDLLATTLEAKGVIYGYTGRIREARFLVEGAISIAEPLGLTVVASRAHSNIGNICLQRDLLAEGESHFQASLGLARRQGDRYAESVAGGNLMTILWLAGRWDELLALSRELLEETPERAGGEFAQLGSALAYVHQGRLVEAEAAIAGVATWQSSDDLEYRLIHRAIVVSAAAVQGHHELALSGAQEILGAGIETLSAASDPIRLSWPAGVGAALHAGRLDAAQELVQALEGLPPGHIPPYLRAELIRFQAQLAAAESRHETVEPDLIAAVEAFRTLGYPYHVALVQTDLAEWLFSQSRTEEASVLLDDALATFRRLRAQPAIERAERLADQLLTAPTG